MDFSAKYSHQKIYRFRSLKGLLKENEDRTYDNIKSNSEFISLEKDCQKSVGELNFKPNLLPPIEEFYPIDKFDSNFYGVRENSAI